MISVVTMWNDAYNSVAKVTYPVMEEYAKKHGYGIRVVTPPADKYEYSKIEAIRKIFEAGISDAVLYLDIDCLITNLNKRVGEFVDGTHDLYVHADVHEINFGAAIFVNSKWMREFLDTILLSKDHYENEQNWLNSFMKASNYKSKHIEVVDHPGFNSYDYSLYEYPKVRKREHGHWHEGDFIIHVPGLGIDKRAEVLESYKEKIVR